MIQDRDQQLAELLDELTKKQKSGDQVDLDSITRQHPDIADELRQLLAVAQIADEFGKSDSETTLAQTTRLFEPTGQLPRAFGDYELLQELGRGGMGVVYKAWERSLQRFVAIKMILSAQHASLEELARFHREAQAAGGLAHRNIVPVYKVGEEDGQPYFAMQFIEGETLSALAKSGPLQPRDAAHYALGIARAVQHAHENGILHRDLKPANVLIDDENEPLVTDFGLAKRLESGATVTGTGAIVGTPSYIAPEIAGFPQQAASPASDIYSIGAILYELLTGRPPFLASSAVETLLLARSEEPVRPRMLNPQIDLDLEFIVRKCLEKRPEHRYSSAEDLARDIEAYLAGDSVTARSGSLVYFLTRFFRDTHHAPVLENWGLLWMWHSLMILLLCTVTSIMDWAGVDSHWAYLALWSIGLVTWGLIFWEIRRRAGPVTYVERQVAHAWAGGVIASIGIFIVEVLLSARSQANLGFSVPVLTLSPTLAVVAGVVFLFKAGTLSGWFYAAAIASFLVAIPMAILGPPLSPLLFGIVSALAFFVPGLKYYRLRQTRGQEGS